MTPSQAMAFVERHGVVLESARGLVPSLAREIAGEAISGSWWSHARGREIFKLTRHVRGAPDVMVCRLVGGKVTYVHRRLWPALLRLADELGAARTNAIEEVHTAKGAHKLTATPLAGWAPAEAIAAGKALSREEAIAALPQGVVA